MVENYNFIIDVFEVCSTRKNVQITMTLKFSKYLNKENISDTKWIPGEKNIIRSLFVPYDDIIKLILIEKKVYFNIK